MAADSKEIARHWVLRVLASVEQPPTSSFLVERVARAWFRRQAEYQQEFLTYVRSRTFRHPDTRREDQFQSLPPEEQAKIYQDWAGHQQSSPESDAQRPNSNDRYSHVEFNIDDHEEKLLNRVMGEQRGSPRQRVLDVCGLKSIAHLIRDVHISVSREKEGTVISISGGGDHDIEFSRMLRYKDRNNASVPDRIVNDRLLVGDDAPEGIGSRMLAQQVLSAEQEGFRTLDTRAAGRAGTSWSGYYVWPRLGYDGPIEEDFLSRMPDDLRDDLESLADGDNPTFLMMMSTPEGRQWWKENGSDVDLEFQLGDYDDNYSRQVLMGYIEEKAKAAGKSKDDYLARVASKPSKPSSSKGRGDGLRISDADEKILDNVWSRIRKELEAKKQRNRQQRDHAKPSRRK